MEHIEMQRPLQGKVALITGAGRGIGQALAQAYAAAGAAVCCAARSQAEVQATAQAIEAAGGTALAVTADVSDEASVSRMVEAYKQLPEDVKGKIEGLRAAHSVEQVFGAKMPIEKRQALARSNPQVEHPVVTTHPETGEKVLYVNPHATHFVNYHTPDRIRCGFDFSPGASHLLNFLISQASIPEYQCRFRWSPGCIAFWDNRSTQHYAVQDYWPAVRQMERAAIIGDIPA